MDSSLSPLAGDAALLQAKSNSLANALDRARYVQDKDQARETAVEFEAVFLASMLNIMFEGVPTDGPFGGGHGEKMFRSILNDQVGMAMARNGGVGLADAVYGEIIRLQEAQQ